MERIKTQLARFAQTAFLIFMGLMLIVYLALGTLYLQQDLQQRELEEQTAKLSAILRNPVPSIDPLQTELNNVNAALTPMADNATIAMLVSLAKEGGIDISEASGKFRLPMPSHGGAASYQITSFAGIQIQGERDKVEAFISLLDSDKPLRTPESSSPRAVVRVVTGLVTQDVEVPKTGKEAEALAEYDKIRAAVAAMMNDNNLVISGIPNPMSVDKGRASNRMGDNPATPIIRNETGNVSAGFEGFPDMTTTASGKGYTGNATFKPGYVLWEHDKASSDNSTRYTTANYTESPTTTYYYTAERDGTIRQWSGPNIALATEYSSSKPTKIELNASVSIDFYFKPK